MAQLPKYVVFKGDNGKYLCGHTQDRRRLPFNKFSGDDFRDPAALYEIFPTNYGGLVLVKSVHFGKFWGLSPCWIWADSDDDTARDPDTLFEVVKVADNAVALRNQGAGMRFCKRLTADYKQSCLNAATHVIDKQSIFLVEEPVLSRKINVTEFRFQNAKTYNQRPVVFISRKVDNYGNTTDQAELRLKHTETQTYTWTNTQTITTSVKASLVSGIPEIGLSHEISISREYTGAYEWGKTVEKSNEIENLLTFNLPPKTRKLVRVLGIIATCSVPFSYQQTDLLTTGKTVTTTHQDGLFTGVNAFEQREVITEEPLS